ncbi:FKBP-type peptidyl-prolyl cis-trans isomerase [Pseudomonadota bacterium]
MAEEKQPEVQIKDLVVGTGAYAELGNRMKVHYTGWLMDGTKFDSSLDTNSPYEFSLGAFEVIRGWDLGLRGMQVGGTRELIIPPELAYGKKGYLAVPPNATLRFEVELLDTHVNRVTKINSGELAELIKEGVTIVDIRKVKDRKGMGMIAGSLMNPAYLDSSGFSPTFLKTMKTLVEKTEKFVFVDKIGRDSSYFSGVLSDRKGYTDIHYLKGGLAKWIKDGHPVVPEPATE